LNEISPEMLDFRDLSEEEHPDLSQNTPPELILGTLRGFFKFIYGKYGIWNDAIILWLNKRFEVE